jgi:SPP1 gp7 family putative phage head morphogenesis protein
MVKRSDSARVVAQREAARALLIPEQRSVLALLDYAQQQTSPRILAQRYGLPLSQVRQVLRDYDSKLPRNLGGEVSVASSNASMFAQAMMPAYNPSTLVGRKGLHVFDRMRKDEQIKAALTFKKLAILASGWEIQPPKDQQPVWEPVRFIEYVFEHMEGSIENALIDLFTAFDYGYAVAEKIFMQYDTGPFAGKIGLRSLRTRAPHDITFKTDMYGNLESNGIIQTVLGKTNKLPVEKFVIFSNGKEFGNYYGVSELEAAYRPWWIKENAYRWLAMLLERFGIPPIFALYNPVKFTPAQTNALQDVITKLQAATAGAIPRPTAQDLELWAPQLAGQTSGVFIPTIELLDRGIARAILMPNLLGMSTDQGPGSFARSKVSFDVFMLITDYYRRFTEETVMAEQIVHQLCDLNYPNLSDYPRFRYLPYSTDTQTDLLQLWTQFLDKEAVHAQPQDEDHIREQLKFPARDKGLGPERRSPKATDDDNSGDDNDGDGGSEEREPLTDDEMADAEEAAIEEAKQQHRPMLALFNETQSREKSKYEKQVDFVAIKRDLDEMEGQALAALVPLLIEVRDRLLRYLRSNFDQNFRVADDLKELRGLAKLREPVMSFLQAAYDRGLGSFEKELTKVRQLQQKPTVSPKDAVRYLRSRRDFVISGINADLTRKVQNKLVKAIDTGQPLDETIMAIEKLFEPYVGNSRVVRDQEQLQPYRIETIIRTNATDAYNRGRLIAAKAAGDFVIGYAYSALLDDRTTDVCRFLDGKIFRRGDSWLEYLKPPRHFNCRSILVPLMVDAEIEEDDFITDTDAGKALDLSGEGFGSKQSAKHYCEHLDGYIARLGGQSSV